MPLCERTSGRGRRLTRLKNFYGSLQLVESVIVLLNLLLELLHGVLEGIDSTLDDFVDSWH